MEDKVIEIARFMQTTEAEMLANLLKSEGIECYVRDGISSRVLFGRADIGGAKVELLEKDVQRASEIMKDYGYDFSEELPGRIVSENTEKDNAEYEKNKSRLSKMMTIILVLLVVLLGVIILLNKYYNGQP
ncbi:MAG: DUF2007 domain-containing protein [Tannerella sp.]|jgi:hypothetical protein|nr:DUF2007 domain-containing protein [Tannerella sp.]